MKPKIFLLVILLSLIVYLLWPRSVDKMNSIAKVELEEHVPQSLLDQLSGPLVSETENYAEFIWFKKLEWGDTSKICIRVYENFHSCKENSWWRSFLCYLEPDVTMNHQWYYFLFPEGTSSFLEVFPSGDKGIEIKTSLNSNTDTIDHSYELTIPTELLVRFLECGYFEVLQNQSDTSFIAFYEPIANFYSKHRKDTVWITTAKVYLNDTIGITIVPHRISE